MKYESSEYHRSYLVVFYLITMHVKSHFDT